MATQMRKCFKNRLSKKTSEAIFLNNNPRHRSNGEKKVEKRGLGEKGKENREKSIVDRKKSAEIFFNFSRKFTRNIGRMVCHPFGSHLSCEPLGIENILSCGHVPRSSNHQVD